MHNKASSINHKKRIREDDRMPSIEIYGHDSRAGAAIQAGLRKHLHHHAFGKDCVVTVVESRCLEVPHPHDAPFLRVYIEPDDDIDNLLRELIACPHLDIAHTHDIEVTELRAFYPKRK